MQEIIAEVASNEVDLQRHVFTDHALSQIAEQCAGKYIHWEFNYTGPPLGRVKSGRLNETGDRVIIEAELFNPLPLSTYIVPAYEILKSEWLPDAVMHGSIRLIAFGMTEHPSDKYIAPAEERKRC